MIVQNQKKQCATVQSNKENNNISITFVLFSGRKKEYESTTNLQRIDASQPTLFVLVFDDDERRTEFIETQRPGYERHDPVEMCSS